MICGDNDSGDESLRGRSCFLVVDGVFENLLSNSDRSVLEETLVESDGLMAEDGVD